MTRPLLPQGGAGDRTLSTSTAAPHLPQTSSSHREAERLVDTLSDAGFPVEHSRTVGHDLRSVEHVTGRLTSGRAALGGEAVRRGGLL